MDPSKFILFYSPFSNYEKCPQLFLWSRGWADIDVGGGPGRRKPIPDQKSKHDSLMGTVIQKVIEVMYNDELWRDPKSMLSKMMGILEHEFDRELKRTFVDWRVSPSRAELYQTCYDGVVGYLRTMRANKLLGSFSRAEFDLMGYINDSYLIGGRADMIIKREDTGVTILDGKNSKTKGRYTSPDQVRWYALLYYLMNGVIPDRVGFVYYRFPYGTLLPDGQIDQGIDWVGCTKDDIDGLAARALEARKSIEDRKFDPDPSPKTCEWCDYQSVCQARISQKAYNSRNRKKRTDSSTDIPVGDDGFFEVG